MYRPEPWNAHSPATFLMPDSSRVMVAGDWSMTLKYSAEWWEKVAARPLETTLQPSGPSEVGSADDRDDRAREPVASHSTNPLSFAEAR
jgi:hypothetical protein